MTITNSLNFFTAGEDAVADEVLSNTSFINSQLITMNLNFLTNHSYTYTPNNFDYNLDLSSGIDETNSTAILMTDTVFFATVFDDYSNATFDITYWTGSGDGQSRWTQNTSVGAGSNGNNTEYSVVSNGSSNDLDLFGQDGELIFKYGYSLQPGSTTFARYYIYLTDGTNKVQCFTREKTNDSDESGNKICRIVINNSAETADVYIDETISSNDLDISSLYSGSGGNDAIYLEIRIEVGDDASSGYIDIQKVGYAKHGDSAGTKLMITDASTITSSTIGIAQTYWTVEPTAETYSISFDNGSNYTTLSNIGTIQQSANGGTQLKWKFSASKVTSIDATTKNIPTATAYGGFYG